MTVSVYIAIALTFFSCLVYPQRSLAQESSDEPYFVRDSILNSTYEEQNIHFRADGRALVFSSNRKGVHYWNQTYYEDGIAFHDADIYISFRDSANPTSRWSRPMAACDKINTQLDDVHPVLLGSSLIYVSWQEGWEYKNGPFFRAKVDQGLSAMLTSKGLSKYIRTFFQKNGLKAIGGMSITETGTLIFSAGQSAEEDMDLFFAKRFPDGQWGIPQRLRCSSKEDERGVFYEAENRLLYFSSNRTGKSFGGYDLYVCTFHESATTIDIGETSNLGSLFNSAHDEIGYASLPSGERYIIRGGDLFRLIEN
ncbi:MAG: hypothetical protein AAF206_04400 [Bacteroidota bacterium]